MENKVKVWLARDKDGELFVYSERPNKLINYWWFGIGLDSFKLDCTKFPSVKWEDDEPTEAYITLAEPQEQPKQKEIDWEQRRYEITKEMMPVIYRQKVAVSNRGQGIMLKDVADIVVGFADALISELKNKNKMNYDISMCDNDDCTMKEQCRRYITYKRYKQDTNKNKRRFVSMVYTEHSINGKCDLFWEFKID